MKLSQVSRACRTAILQTGGVEKRINQLEKSKSGKILKDQFYAVDDIQALCYTMRLERSGVVYGWGGNSHGQLTDQVFNEYQTLPAEISKFESVTNINAGYAESFVVKDNGLFAVGNNHFSQLGLGNCHFDEVSLPSKVMLPPIKRLANRAHVSFAVDTSGRLWSWGLNEFGMLGRNYEGPADEMIGDGVPQMIDSLREYEVKQVACGNLHACCLTTDGKVFTWGHKDYIGHGSLNSHICLPTKLNVENISQVSCGASHTLLLSADQKTIWAFGDNSHGQLGHGQEVASVETPVKVPFPCEKVIVKLQCSGHDSAILSEDGEIRVWGRTWNGESSNTPRIINIGPVVEMSLGGGFMLALTSKNRLYAFGKNNYGQCGKGHTTDFIEEPVEVQSLNNIDIKQISAGDDHCLILCNTKDRSGVAFGWGFNSRGQLTDQLEIYETQTLPIEITNFRNAKNIAAGYDASFVIKDNENLAVGYNEFRQLGLGNGKPGKVYVPSKVELLAPIRSLAGCGVSSFAVDTSGRLWSWGHNDSGQLGRITQGLVDGTPQIIHSLQKYKIMQVASGYDHACCLTNDGEVLTWGYRDYVGQGYLDSDSIAPTKLNIEKISKISCGTSHTLLLSADKKTVWAFGNNDYGQLGHDPELQTAETPVKVPFLGEKVIVNLQGFYYRSAVLSADGEITLWGLSWNEVPNRGSTRIANIKQVVDISLGGNFMLALTAENRLYAFGRNNLGQCGQGYTSDFIEEPVEVKNLRNVRIKQISAGYDYCLIKCAKL